MWDSCRICTWNWCLLAVFLSWFYHRRTVISLHHRSSHGSKARLQRVPHNLPNSFTQQILQSSGVNRFWLILTPFNWRLFGLFHLHFIWRSWWRRSSGRWRRWKSGQSWACGCCWPFAWPLAIFLWTEEKRSFKTFFVWRGCLQLIKKIGGCEYGVETFLIYSWEGWVSIWFWARGGNFKVRDSAYRVSSSSEEKST